MCFDNLKIEFLPEPYRTIAEITDINTAVLLAKHFGGEQVYFPKYETIERPIIHASLLKEFNGYNFKYLSKKYKLAERTVRRICVDSIMAERTKPLEGQITFDDIDY